MTASHDLDYLASRGAYPREQRLANLAGLDKSELVETADRMATVAVTLGEHLADIAAMVGLDRDTDDLAIPPNVKRVVDEHQRYAQALNEIRAYVQLGAERWAQAHTSTPTLIDVHNDIWAIINRVGRP